MTKTEVFFNTLNIKGIAEKEYSINKEIVINNVKMDSKTLEFGDLFVAIRGGNNYVTEALEKGAYIVYDNKDIEINEKYVGKTFLVKDSVLFMQQFAKNWRKNINIKVIGITGSNGKTTVKDMTYHLLSQKLKGKKTEGNLNNHIGLPFTLLRAEVDDDFIILEMGMSGFGEIDLLGEISEPDISIITNIGESHLEYLKTKGNVMKAKTEIINHTKNTLIINGDDEYLKNIESSYKKCEDFEIVKVLNGEINKFFKGTKNFYYSDFSYNEEGSKFTLEYYGRRCKENIKREINTNVIGVHNILNLTIALAVAKIMFVEDKYLLEAIKNITLTDMRFQQVEKNGIMYINDSYNASPLSMEKSLETFSKLYGDREKIVVLGDMLELGENELDYHRNLWEIIVKSNLDKIFLYGERMKSLYKKLLEQNCDKVKHFNDKKEIEKEIEKLNKNRELAILVKGSRGMKLEEIIK